MDDYKETVFSSDSSVFFICTYELIAIVITLTGPAQGRNMSTQRGKVERWASSPMSRQGSTGKE